LASSKSCIHTFTNGPKDVQFEAVVGVGVRDASVVVIYVVIGGHGGGIG